MACKPLTGKNMTSTPHKEKCFMKNENVEETPVEYGVCKRNENDCGTVMPKAARKLLVNEFLNSNKENDITDFSQSSIDDYDTGSDDSEAESLKEKIQKRHKLLQERKSALVNRLDISSITAALKKKPSSLKRKYKIQKPTIPLTASRSSQRIQKNKPLSLNEKDLAELSKKKQEVPIVAKPKITNDAFKMTGFSLSQCTDEKKKIFTSFYDPYYDSSSDDDSMPWYTNSFGGGNGVGNAYEHDLFMKNSLPYMKTVHKPLLSRNEREYASVLRNLKIVEKNVTPSQIFSMDFHADTNKTILAAGDKEGYLGIWDVNNNVEVQSNVYQFRPHASRISGLKFSNSDPYKLYMCSYDGTIRYADLSKSEIGETIFDDQSYSLTGFQFLSQDSDNCIVASCSGGRVLIVDRRENSRYSYSTTRAFIVDPKHRNLRSVSVHPKISQCICVPNSNGCVNFFDHRWLTLRNKKCKPFLSLKAHVKSVFYAHFDPHNGNHVVTVSADNSVKILNSTGIDRSKVFVTKACYQHTGTTSIGKVPLSWHPTKENIFAVGNMRTMPKQIDIYNPNLDCLYKYKGYYISGSCLTLSFHPSKPIIAGTKCSGKMFILK